MMRIFPRLVFFLSVPVLFSSLQTRAQSSEPVAHARRILELLQQGKTPDVAREFNAQMAAALPAEVLGQVWLSLGSQVGALKSEISQQSASSRTGTAVTLGLQFERAALNMIVVIDADNKIAGLQFVPRPAEATAAAAALPAGILEESVTVGGGDFPLPGTLTTPAGAGRIPAVVLVHGSGPEDRDETLGPNKPFRDLAWGLASRGIAVLRYEKRTKQYAAKLASSSMLTVQEESIEDAIFAVQLLQRHARIDASHIVVLGHSLGGMLAPRIGSQSKQIAGLAILAGNSRPLPELMVEQVEYMASISPDPAAQQASIAAVKQQVARIMDPALPLSTPAGELLGAPAAYWKDLNAYKPVAVAATLTVPILVLQGERDYQVTMRDFEGWRNGLKGRSGVTFKSYADLNHVFMTGTGKSTPAEYQNPGKVAEIVIADIAAWVKSIP
jgi:dienelactone hydrolase